MRRKRVEPKNEDLRNAALMAEAWLLIESAKMYGLITGGPKVDSARCAEIIERAKKAGVATYTKADIQRVAELLIAEVNTRKAA